MIDKIYIRKLSVSCLIGLYPYEKARAQEIQIDLELGCDLSTASQSDSIEDTIDYEHIEHQVISICKERSHNLLETLAEKIAKKCLGDKKISTVKVKIKKPAALKHSKYAAVEIIRKQS